MFAEPSPIDPDSDGDGVLDGADDQDVDGYDNFTEMELARGRSGLFVNPYNPCLPNPYAITCSPLGADRPRLGVAAVRLPDKPMYQGSMIPLTWSLPTSPQSGDTFWNGSQGAQGPDVNTTTP